MPHPFQQVHPDNYFWVVDGKTVKSLHELQQAFKSMDAGTYDYHQSRNDFHSWVKQAHNDPQLARLVREAKNQSHAAEVVGGWIKGFLADNQPARKRSVHVAGRVIKPKVKLPEPTVMQPLWAKGKYQFLFAVGAFAAVVFLFSVGSYAQGFTGASVAHTGTESITFLALGGIIAILVILVIALHAIHNRKYHRRK